MLLATLLVIQLLPFATSSYVWAATFDVPQDRYIWQMQATEGGSYQGYRQPSMQMVIFAVADSTAASLAAVVPDADRALNATCTMINVQQVTTPVVPGHGLCDELHFAVGLDPTSTFFINTTNVPSIAVFTQHTPTNFERDMHFLKDVRGGNIEPVAQLPEPSSPDGPDRPWGSAIAAAFVVTMCTFIGVVFLGTAFGRMASAHPTVIFVIANAFASGALLAAAFYLMLYESTHLITTGDEASAAAYWGTMIILGFAASNVLEIGVQAIVKADAAPSPPTAPDSTMATVSVEAVAVGEKATGTAGGPAASPPALQRRVRVLCGVLLGDCMHNFVDGLIIGFGFMFCDSTVGWTITVSTVYHELAQEVSDYLVLTDPQQGGLKPATALLLNFVSGLSCVLGAIVIVAQGEQDIRSQGLLLAFGGGVYIQIGASECMGRVHESVSTNALRLGALGAFCLGAFAIGIVLLEHDHCVPATATLDADGHFHGR